MYLLDSSALIRLAAEHEGNRAGPVTRFLRGKRNVFISVVSAQEFLEGIEDESAGLQWLADGRFTWLTIGRGIGRQCAALQRRMMETGRRLGENDAWIAATALASGLEVVGDDVAFARVPGLSYHRIN